MASQLVKATIALLFTCLAPCALAQDAKQDQGAATATSPATRTGKERLGPKWSDEQRIDNCKVPPDKRGTRPRPSECTNAPPS